MKSVIKNLITTKILLFSLITIAQVRAMYQPELDQPAPQGQIMQDVAPARARNVRERVFTPNCLRATRACCFYGSMYLFYRGVLGLPQPAPEIAVATIALVQHTPIVMEGQRLCGRMTNYHHDRDGL